MVPLNVHNNNLTVCIEQTADVSESTSCSDEGTELHPILRTGSSTKFKPIPKLKAKRRQKAKLFLERIKKQSKNTSSENENVTQTMQYKVYKQNWSQFASNELIPFGTFFYKSIYVWFDPH